MLAPSFAFDPPAFDLVDSTCLTERPRKSTSHRKVNPTLRAPYLMQSAVALERQLPAHTTMAVTFTDTHGLYQLRSQDINAPLPGTHAPHVPGSGDLQLGNSNPVFIMESAGLYNQTQLITTFKSQANKYLSLIGSYLQTVCLRHEAPGRAAWGYVERPRHRCSGFPRGNPQKGRSGARTSGTARCGQDPRSRRICWHTSTPLCGDSRDDAYRHRLLVSCHPFQAG